MKLGPSWNLAFVETGIQWHAPFEKLVSRAGHLRDSDRGIARSMFSHATAAASDTFLCEVCDAEKDSHRMTFVDLIKRP